MLRLFRLLGDLAFLIVIPTALFPNAGSREPDCAGRNETSSVLPDFAGRIRDSRDRSILSQKRYADSVMQSMERNIAAARKRLKAYGDSITISVRDSLDSTRKRRLEETVTALGKTINDLLLEKKILLQEIAGIYRQQIQAGSESAGRCIGCASAEDSSGRVELFGAFSDSVASVFEDSVSAVAEGLEEILVDTLEENEESLSDLAETLLEEQRDENEARASRATVELLYNSPVVYRGRDNGVREYSFTPSVSYQHRSGLAFSMSAAWLSRAETKWDVAAAGIAYQGFAGDNMQWSISFTHLWFSSASAQARSVLNNSVGFAGAYDFTHVAVAASISVDFQSKAERTMMLSVTAPVTLGESVAGGELTVEPCILGVYGQQDVELVLQRTQKAQKAKKMAVMARATQARTVFGVMDYEFEVPLNYRRGNWTVRSAFTLVTPLNVLDSSSSKPFGMVSVEGSVELQ